MACHRAQTSDETMLPHSRRCFRLSVHQPGHFTTNPRQQGLWHEEPKDSLYPACSTTDGRTIERQVIALTCYVGSSSSSRNHRQRLVMNRVRAGIKQHLLTVSCDIVAFKGPHPSRSHMNIPTCHTLENNTPTPGAWTQPRGRVDTVPRER